MTTRGRITNVTTDHPSTGPLPTGPVSTVAEPAVSPIASGPAAADGSTAIASARRLGGWLDAIFPADDRGPAGRRGLLWAVAAVLVGAAVSLGHVGRGVNTFNVLFAEDGTYYLTDAWNRTFFDAVLRPPQGYFVIVPRLLTEVASVVPLQWGPAVLTAEAAIVTALMAIAVYVASGAHLHHPLARLVAAAPILAVPVGESDGATAANNVATLQFAALYLTLWMLLWVPTRRRVQLTAVLIVLGVAISTFLSVLLLPFALLRLYLRRDRMSAAMAGSLLLGAAMNVSALALHLTARPSYLVSYYHPVWALRGMVRIMLTESLFGYGPVVGGGGATFTVPRTIAIIAAFAILVVVAAVGLFRVTRPNWPLAAVLVVYAVLLFCACVMSAGAQEVRYVIAPELMLFAAMAAVLVPRSTATGVGQKSRALAVAPLAVVAAFIAAVSGLNYNLHSGRSESAPWGQKVGEARALCADTRLGAVNVYPLWTNKSPDRIPKGQHIPRDPSVGWPVRLPCSRLR
jgi:hypothetical protein